ncbi:MAG: hypothetical protein ACTSRH_07315, partial [Promethearchaeota archaeon]
TEGKFGIICFNCLMIRARFREIQEFMKNNDIPEMDKNDAYLQIIVRILGFLFMMLQVLRTIQWIFT